MNEKEINLLGIRQRTILSYFNGVRGKELVVMEAITEEQEKRIDKSEKYYGAIRFDKGDGVIIEAKDIYLYGEVNLEDKNDVFHINKFNLINPESSFIYSNFDYDKGVYTTIDGHSKGSTTHDAFKWFKFNHCLINKPQRIIVYKCLKCML